MAEARVRIVLDDEEGGGNTWVSVVPVRRKYANRFDVQDVIAAAGEALGMFASFLLRDRESVAEKLIELERVDA